MVEAEAEAEAVNYPKRLLEAEAEAVQKSTASASLLRTIVIITQIKQNKLSKDNFIIKR